MGRGGGHGGGIWVEAGAWPGPLAATRPGPLGPANGPAAPPALSYVELIVEYNTAVYSGLKVARRGGGGAHVLNVTLYNTR